MPISTQELLGSLEWTADLRRLGVLFMQPHKVD